MRKVITLAALAGFLWCGVAGAQNQEGQLKKPLSGTIIGGVLSDTTTKVMRMVTTGSVSNSDEARDRDAWAILNGGNPIINDTLTVSTGLAYGVGNGANVAFTAESSLVISAGQYQRFSLALRVIPGQGDTTTAMVFAVQVRGHIAAVADTNSTFAWTPKQWDITTPGTVGAFTTNDSTVAKVTSTVGSVALNNEFTVKFDPKWYSNVGAAYANFSFPSGRIIPLIDQSGVWFWAPYISVRVRCLRGASKPKVIAYLVGRP